VYCNDDVGEELRDHVRYLQPCKSTRATKECKVKQRLHLTQNEWFALYRWKHSLWNILQLTYRVSCSILQFVSFWHAFSE